MTSSKASFSQEFPITASELVVGGEHYEVSSFIDQIDSQSVRVAALIWKVKNLRHWAKKYSSFPVIRRIHSNQHLPLFKILRLLLFIINWFRIIEPPIFQVTFVSCLCFLKGSKRCVLLDWFLCLILLACYLIDLDEVCK